MQVKKVAHLARIQLSDSECTKFEKQFGDILGHIEKMNKLNLDGIEPACHPFDLKNVFREDEVQPSLGAENLMKIAPAADKNMIQVPQIVEGKSK